MSRKPLALALLVAGAAPIAHADAPVAVQIVDALNQRYGVHLGYRANHAKGVVVEGRFTPTPQAAALTRSPIYAGAALPVTARFSDAGGLPTVADAAPIANPHGLAIKFHLPNGSDSDIVVNAFKFFPVATPEDFRDLQLAAATTPPGSPPSPQLKAFLQTHPSVQKANAALGIPDSFADEAYYGVDAFYFTNKDGEKRAFRYIIAPQKLVHIDKADAAKRAPDFLFDELPQRLAKGPVTFHIQAQLAERGDPTNDATQAWPDDRKVVDLGTLTIERVAADSDAQQRKLLFIPGRLTDGIAPSDDPLIAARDGAYAVSFGRRQAAGH